VGGELALTVGEYGAGTRVEVQHIGRDVELFDGHVVE
jgi:hypothetical protein